MLPEFFMFMTTAMVCLLWGLRWMTAGYTRERYVVPEHETHRTLDMLFWIVFGLWIVMFAGWGILRGVFVIA